MVWSKMVPLNVVSACRRARPAFAPIVARFFDDVAALYHDIFSVARVPRDVRFSIMYAIITLNPTTKIKDAFPAIVYLSLNDYRLYRVIRFFEPSRVWRHIAVE
jgi:hypothetical protein